MVDMRCWTASEIPAFCKEVGWPIFKKDLIVSTEKNKLLIRMTVY